MPGRLLISDANILIDMMVGGLVDTMFRLDYEYATPDELFDEELRASHQELLQMGLRLIELAPEAVLRAQQLSRQYTGVSSHDVAVLALAKQENVPLLTGDKKLKQVCQAEKREVRGTIWLVGEMLSAGLVTASEAETAYNRMEQDGSRLPWDEVRQQIKRFSKNKS